MLVRARDRRGRPRLVRVSPIKAGRAYSSRSGLRAQKEKAPKELSDAAKSVHQAERGISSLAGSATSKEGARYYKDLEKALQDANRAIIQILRVNGWRI